MRQTENSLKRAKQWRAVQRSLHDQFHFDDLKPGQAEIIRSVLAGKNTLAIMPTGGGKSLCYQLPSSQLEGTTIVVSPLISLMKDQKEKSSDKGMEVVELNSQICASDIVENLQKMNQEMAEIVYVTPERFTSPGFLKMAKKIDINFIVIDEAHCVSQWGHDFRPAYLEVGRALRLLGSPPLLALTATATDEVAKDIQVQLGLADLMTFRSSVLRENLLFEAAYLDSDAQKMEKLISLVNEMKTSSGIIYTATVKAATEVHRFLETHQIHALLYHGKLSGKERSANQNEFMNNSPRLIVATNAFGMGIDKADIRFVIHFQFPGSLEAYYQEAGRAGRDGLAARCILLYLKKDKCTQSLFLGGKYPSLDEVSSVYGHLRSHPLSGPPVKRPEVEEELAKSISRKKLAVIFSLLKQLKVLRENRAGEFTLRKTSLTNLEIENLAKVYEARGDRDRSKLNQVISYAQSALCRWKKILHYFNEDSAGENCQHCDNCLNPSRRDLARLT